MKKNRSKIILIVLFIIGAVWALYPTYRSAQLKSDLEGFGPGDSVRKAAYLENNSEAIKSSSAKAIKLGLDLRGGIYVTMEVDVLKFIEEQANQKDEIFNQVLAATKVAESKSEDPVVQIFLQKFQQIASPKGKTLANYFFFNDVKTGEDREIQASLQKGVDEAVDRAIEIIRNRVDQYGLTEPTIQKQGSRRIIIELPGVADPTQVHQLLSGTAQLQFHTLKSFDIVNRVIQRIDRYVAGTKGIQSAVTDSSAAISASAIDSATKKTAFISTKPDSNKRSKLAGNTKDTTIAPVTAAINPQDSQKRADSLAYAGLSPDEAKAKMSREKPLTFLLFKNVDQRGRVYVSEADRTAALALLAREDVKPLYKDEVKIAFSRPIKDPKNGDFYEVFFLNPVPELTGKVITDARADISQQNGAPEVTMQMDDEGARIWRRVTRSNIGNQVAIVLDNVVYSAPVVNGEIPNGNSQITGVGDLNEANLMKIVLKAGALPAPVKIIQESVVGPSLGADSIEKGVTSVIWGLLVVILFMAMYYMTGGIVADFAVLINLLFTLAILATFGATLTLPGMAGLVLTVGIAVDANVLIYERIREELAAGKSLKLAMDDGYRRAFAPIFDGHLTAFFSGIILYAFGTGTVQGFAVTLMIGIAASLFTAIVITRVIFDILLEKKPELIKFG